MAVMTLAVSCASDSANSEGTGGATSTMDAAVPPQDSSTLDGANDAGTQADVGTDAGPPVLEPVPCPAPEPGDLSSEEYAEQGRAALCALHTRCGEATQPFFAPGTVCRTPGTDTLTPQLARGSVCFDPQLARDCLEAFTTLNCTDLIRQRWTVRCFKVHRPLLDEGEPCTSSTECFAGRCVFGAECPGHCERKTNCATYLDCPLGIVCTAGECIEPQPEGGPCDQWYGCQEGLTCSPNTGLCRPVAESGGCQTWDCDPSLYCYNGGGGITECRERAPEGESCSPELLNFCAEGLVCANGTCRVARGPGDTCQCDASCPEGFTCTVDGCAELPLPPDTCDPDYGCWEGDCVDGICQRREEGANCSRSVDCKGHCDIDLVFGSECVNDSAEGESCGGELRCERGLQCRDGVCREPCSSE